MAANVNFPEGKKSYYKVFEWNGKVLLIEQRLGFCSEPLRNRTML